MRQLGDYKDMLINMKVNVAHGRVAPHKAILLLAVIDLIESGVISEPFVPLSDELIRAFKRNCEQYVPNESSAIKLSYPFYHLSSSSFWRLKRNPYFVGQCEYNSIGSLRRDFMGAEMEDDLFYYLCCHRVREEIRALLKERYLPDASAGSAGAVAPDDTICGESPASVLWAADLG